MAAIVAETGAATPDPAVTSDAPPSDWRDPLFRGLPKADAQEMADYARRIWEFNQRNGADT